MIKINKKLGKGKWYDYPQDSDIRFLIKPFPFTKNLFEFLTAGKSPDDNQMEQAIIMFQECLLDWEGFINEDTDKPLKCNKEHKQLIFDNDFTIVNFILEKANAEDNKILKQVKN